MENEKRYTCITTDADQTKRLAASLAPSVFPGLVIMLTGDLGAGKTQFAQGLARALGVEANVVSPTFNLVISYEGTVFQLHHFDLYRLESAEELEDIGFYEYLEDGGVSLVEWGDKFPDALPPDRLELVFRAHDAHERNIVAQAYGEQHQRMLEAWARGAGAAFWQARE